MKHVLIEKIVNDTKQYGKQIYEQLVKETSNNKYLLENNSSVDKTVDFDTQLKNFKQILLSKDNITPSYFIKLFTDLNIDELFKEKYGVSYIDYYISDDDKRLSQIRHYQNVDFINDLDELNVLFYTFYKKSNYDEAKNIYSKRNRKQQNIQDDPNDPSKKFNDEIKKIENRLTRFEINTLHGNGCAVYTDSIENSKNEKWFCCKTLLQIEAFIVEKYNTLPFIPNITISIKKYEKGGIVIIINNNTSDIDKIISLNPNSNDVDRFIVTDLVLDLKPNTSFSSFKKESFYNEVVQFIDKNSFIYNNISKIIKNKKSSLLSVFDKQDKKDISSEKERILDIVTQYISSKNDVNKKSLSCIKYYVDKWKNSENIKNDLLLIKNIIIYNTINELSRLYDILDFLRIEKEDVDWLSSDTDFFKSYSSLDSKEQTEKPISYKNLSNFSKEILSLYVSSET